MKKTRLIFLATIFCIIFSTSILADVVIFNPETSEGVVYEYYLDMYGNQIKQRTSHVPQNNIYMKTAPFIDGYAAINARINDNNLIYSGTPADVSDGVSITMTNFSRDGDYVVFLYGEDEYNRGVPDDLTSKQDVEIVIYDNSTGKRIDTITKEEQPIGQNFVYTPSKNLSKNGKSYRFVKSEPTRNDDDEIEIFTSRDKKNNVIYLYYNEGKMTDRFITVKYIDIETDEEFDEDIISSLTLGDEYTYTVKNKGGYNFVSSSPPSSGFSNSITIKIRDDNDDNIIYCYYKNYNSDGINQYDDNNQYYVSPTDTFYNSSGSYKPVTRADGIAVNTLPYYSFILGYPDSSFRPNAPLTRAEASQMFYSVAQNKNNGKLSFQFKDLNYNDWYYKPISYLCSIGKMNGYSDGTVKPNKYITRAEFIKMATDIAGFEETGSTVPFYDVNKTDWFYPYVVAGVNKDFLSGYSDNTFRPKNNITRAEATKIVDQMIGRTLEYESQYKDIYYKDVSTTNWAYPYIKMGNGVAR